MAMTQMIYLFLFI